MISILNFIFSRKIWRYLPFILLAILLFLLYGFYKKYQGLQHQVESYKRVIEQKGKVNNFKDNSGRWHSETKPVVIESDKALKTIAKNDSNLILLQTEIKGLKKDLRNLISANVIGSTSTTYMETDLRDSFAVINDTLKYLIQKFDKVTPWMEEHGEIINGKIRERRITYDTIIVAAYTHKKWFLGKKQIEVEAVSRNPDNRICIKTSVINRK